MPDLTSQDFFLWDHIKELVYETPVDSEADIVAQIAVVADRIFAFSEMFAAV